MVALGAFALISAKAQQVSTSPQYTVQRWDAGAAEDGLPQNTVTAIVQTRDGYLWIGTYSGLARFDGLRFTVFDGNNSPGLASSRVTSLFEAGDGTLWIGHETGEVSRYRSGVFETIRVPASWSGGKIQDLAADAAGDIWLLNADGLLARLRDGVVLTPESGTASKIFELTCSRGGRIWVGRNGRISELRDGKLCPLVFPEAYTNHYVSAMGASRDEGLWLGVGAELRKWKDGAWTQEVRTTPWSWEVTHKLVETSSGELALSASTRGFALVTSGPGQPLTFNRASGFASDWVTALCEDREGNLWVGTGGAGLAVLRKGVIQTVTAPDEWLGRAVLAVHPGAADSLWVGTEGAGLYHFRTNGWTNYSVSAGISVPYVWSVLETADHRLWVGTWNGLLMRRGDRYEVPDGLEDVSAHVTALLPAADGGIWAGTGAGLLHYQAGACTWYGQEGTPAKRDVRALAQARDGAIWLGTAGGGLGRLRNGKIQWFHRAEGLAAEDIGCLYFDTAETLWIGTRGGGLNRFQDGRFATINHVQGLPSGHVSHIVEDAQGFFWMSSNNGIIRAARAGLNACADGTVSSPQFRTYGISDGMPTLICSSGLQAAGCQTADGRLWFATSRGLVAVTPGNVSTNRFPPPVVVERVLVDEKLLPLNSAAGVPLHIPPGRHRIEFQYTGLSFIASDRIQFKHRLRNWESDWIDSGVKRTANYTYLPPGDYRFEVAARNSDGVWSEQDAQVAFTVLPFFWQTWWFRLVTGVVLVAGAAGLVWFDTRRRMRRKLDRLERQRAVENERARIAKDIHDDLGASLTRITMLSDPLRGEGDAAAAMTSSLHRIHGMARDLTRSMDEIVWAINPQHDTLDSLMAYLESFAQEFLGTARVRCRLDMPLEYPVVPLTAEVRHNLFLAFKEGLHNVVKHSGATEARIAAAVTTTGFTLTLADNGCGFAQTELGRDGFGNGLVNMPRRLAQFGGDCRIESAPGRGTKITWHVPWGSRPPE